MSKCEEKPLLIFNFGGGVQSTALALLAINRDPRFLDIAEDAHIVFLWADTGAERLRTYQHVWRMADWITAKGWRFEVVRKEWDALDDHLYARHSEGRGGIASPPLYLELHGGGYMPIKRACTREWKVYVLEKTVTRLKEELQPSYTKRFFGISSDEKRRMKEMESDEYCYPLVRQMHWTRWHCEEYIKQVATYPDGTPLDVPRSSCVFCPFHSKAEWRDVQSDPDDWARALKMDNFLETAAQANEKVAGLPAQRLYLTKNGVRLRDADFTPAPTDQLELFGEERIDQDDHCVHHCGV